MFTGIIECLGEILNIEKVNSNKRFRIKSSISKELKVDQSISHDGVCLTVINKSDEWHELDLVNETLLKSKFNNAKPGDILNLERCLRLSDRLDGHIVQGHVDQVGNCVDIIDNNGSWIFTFQYKVSPNSIIVEKGSICINGISLTAFDVGNQHFSVAIIPYTFQHTNMGTIKVGEGVNLEFDIIGKYVKQLTIDG